MSVQFLNLSEKVNCVTRVAEVVQRHEVWTGTKILSPNICYIVAILWFVVIYAPLEDSGQKKCSFGAKQCFLGKKCPITWLVMSCLLILLISCQKGHICLPQLCSAFKDVEIKRWATHSLTQ